MILHGVCNLYDEPVSVHGMEKGNEINKDNNNKKTMKPNLKIELEDLKALYAHTKNAYPGMTFKDWCKESEKSYLSYFGNRELFNNRKYTYSQFVNAQIMAIAY